MSTKRLAIKSISRRRPDGTDDTLHFAPGVNVMFGDGNTGKTKWLETIDYLLGDEVSAEEREDSENPLFRLFEAAVAVLEVGGKELIVERRWREPKSLGKVYVNGDPETAKEYCHRLMGLLDLPVVHYPQGNPYSARKWPELGWRALFRHLYRRETMWSDLADRQPEVDQHACLMAFVGVADKLFSQDYGDLISKNKRLWQLQVQCEQFMAMLDQISRDLLHTEGLRVAVTPDSLAKAQKRLADREAQIANERGTFLESLQQKTEVELLAQKQSVPDFASVSDRLVELESQREVAAGAVSRIAERMAELTEIQQLLAEELQKLTRAQEAGKVLSDLRVTHCPACDQPIGKSAAEDVCYVCGRPIPASSAASSSTRRIDFEMEQTESESQETKQLLDDLKQEHEATQKREREIDNELVRLRKILQPIRQAAAAVLPPELFLLDVEYGQVQERARQLTRIEGVLSQREHLLEEIQGIQAEIAEIEAVVETATSDVNFVSAATPLQDGMNTYLNRIFELNPNSWLGQHASVRLAERSFQIKVGDSDWRTKLGASQRLFFLFAYHYALMNLCRHDKALFPGFLMIDFPANLEDRAAIADKENFILEPFVELLAKGEMAGCQLLAAGRSFQGLKGVNAIEFSKVWKD